MLPAAVHAYFQEQNTLIYSGALKPFFNEAKNRIDKGGAPTESIKGHDGTYDSTKINPKHSAWLTRCGAKPNGSGFVVIDIDIKGGQTVEKDFAQLHCFLAGKCQCIVRTGSGGYHYYYRMPEGVDWQVERNIDSLSFDTMGGTQTFDCKNQVDLLAGGIGVYLPGTSFTHDGQTYEYTYVKGSLAEAGPVPDNIAQHFASREGMVPAKKRVVKTAKKTAPGATTPTMASPEAVAPVAPVALITPMPITPRAMSPPKVAEDDLKIIASLVDCITGEWISTYDNWRNLGFCLKTITAGRGESMYVKVARRSPRHDTDKDEEDTRHLFSEASASGKFGFASLNHWARLCSPDKHHDCFKNNYLHLLSQGNKGHADIFANELAGSCVYDSEAKKFYLWVEHKQLWVEVNEDNITSQFMTLMPLVVKRLRAGLLPSESKEEETPLHKFLKDTLKAFQNNMPEAVMKCVRDTLNPKISYRNIDAFELDKNPNLLPLANGVWNFKEGRLEAYTRQHYLSKRAGRGHPEGIVEYDASASQDDIKHAMRVWFKGNQKVIDFIQYWLGYVLTGHTTRQEFLILYGKSGGNGKSALIAGILQHDIMGRDYACSMGEDALTKVGGNNDDIYYGLDSRLAVVTEAGGGGKKAEEINEEALKRITGEDIMSAQAKFKGKKEGVFKARLVFCCNSMPRMPQSQAQRRRTIVAEMNTKMVDKTAWDELTPEEQATGDWALKDPQFMARLRANRSGSLNWLLDGARKYMANPTMSAPVDVLRYTDEALSLADDERIWFMDAYAFDKTTATRCEVEFKEVADRFMEHFGIKSTNMSARGKFLRKIKTWIGEQYVTGDSAHGYIIKGLTAK
jgi:hypothetical protein